MTVTLADHVTQIASSSTNNDRIASGASCHRRVEPSMSENNNVTVPDGGTSTPPASHGGEDLLRPAAACDVQVYGRAP